MLQEVNKSPNNIINIKNLIIYFFTKIENNGKIMEKETSII